MPSSWNPVPMCDHFVAGFWLISGNVYPVSTTTMIRTLSEKGKVPMQTKQRNKDGLIKCSAATWTNGPHSTLKQVFLVASPLVSENLTEIIRVRERDECRCRRMLISGRPELVLPQNSSTLSSTETWRNQINWKNLISKWNWLLFWRLWKALFFLQQETYIFFGISEISSHSFLLAHFPSFTILQQPHRPALRRFLKRNRFSFCKTSSSSPTISCVTFNENARGKYPNLIWGWASIYFRN